MLHMIINIMEIIIIIMSTGSYTVIINACKYIKSGHKHVGWVITDHLECCNKSLH